MTHSVVVFRYPGDKWYVYGEPLAGFDYSARSWQCRQAHPNAQVEVLQAPTREALVAKVQQLVADGTLAESSAFVAQGVPPHEAGPGGDKDTPYVGVSLPTNARELSYWARLAARAARGEVGGPNDGQLQLPPAPQEGAA